MYLGDVMDQVGDRLATIVLTVIIILMGFTGIGLK